MSAKTKKAPIPNHAPTDVRGKFANARSALRTALVERDSEIDLILTALVAREHVLLVGPPGTAKSRLLESLMDWMAASKFSILLTKFTAPEEVCGPVSLTGLKNDQFYRLTSGTLPEAEVAFLDEINR